MSEQSQSLPTPEAPATQEYLTSRLDGARDLYLLALALGQRSGPDRLAGRMIREARIHFAAVLEECRMAGLETAHIAQMLGKTTGTLSNSIAPEIWQRLEELIAEHRQERLGPR